MRRSSISCRFCRQTGSRAYDIPVRPMRVVDDAPYTQTGSPSSRGCSAPCCISGAVERIRSCTHLLSARGCERADWPKTHTHTHTHTRTHTHSIRYTALPMKRKHACWRSVLYLVYVCFGGVGVLLDSLCLLIGLLCFSPLLLKTLLTLNMNKAIQTIVKVQNYNNALSSPSCLQ